VAKQDGAFGRIIVVLAAILIGVPGLAVLAIGGIVAWRYLLPPESTPTYSDVVEHFKYGSIGSEVTGLPYWVWKALPELVPEKLPNGDLSEVGFLYETDADGNKRDLPIGLSRRTLQGVERAWFNCALCHTGTVQKTSDAEREIVAGMPSNNLDMYKLVSFVVGLADDPRLGPDSLIPAMKKAGAPLDLIDEVVWRFVAIPTMREGLLQQRANLAPLLAYQPAWGPGRVDTFNPYKIIQFHQNFVDLPAAEKIGVSDFPSIFSQRPRRDQKMELHWDGNNPSLQERNLSAALGAGVTERSVDHAAIERVAEWLLDFRAAPSPYAPDPVMVESGKKIYMEQCVSCHGWQSPDGYVFEGEFLGKVEPNAKLGVDQSRLDSYTEKLRDYQLTLFKDVDGGKYRFRHFRKTDGYANLPLDGLWLRAPYLHNGSVPTLVDLLSPPAQRPKAFLRSSDVLDPEKGGFLAQSCDTTTAVAKGFCYDTSVRGNGNGGHVYGTDLPDSDKEALVAYLLTF
jgi:hypothetical protein